MKLNFIKIAEKTKPFLAKLTIFLLLFSFSFISLAPTTEATGALATYKDTISTSRPSVFTPITGTVSVGANVVPVTSSLGLNQGDTVILCATSTCATNETKVIANIPSLTQVTLTAVTTGSYTASSFLFLKIVASHVITFTTHTAVTAGKFNVYIPGDANPNDGVATTTTVGFDFNGMATSDITLGGGTAGSISTSTSAGNLLITIPFTGTIASSTAITITIGVTNKPINPVKTAISGTADTYNIQTDELDGSSVLIDTTTGKVATIESVAVSATVAPSLTFTINAVANSTTIAGNPTNAASTATTVPFGVLTVNATTTVAQYIHIDTNSTSGYNVTVQQDGSLRKVNGTTIVDFNSGSFADNEGVVGFGFALQNKTNSPVTAANLYNNGGAKFNSIGFSSTSPFTIMTSAGPASGDEAYVAYRVKVNATQAQGLYQNLVTYIATPVY